MDIYDTSIMDPDPPRPDERDESSPQRREDDAPPPPADDEDVSPTLGALKNVGGAALAVGFGFGGHGVVPGGVRGGAPQVFRICAAAVCCGGRDFNCGHS